MSVIWYVHGAGASENSFNLLFQQLPRHDARFFTYTVADTVECCIEALAKAISMETEPVVLIGHSLGGIICRSSAAMMPNVSHLITMCAPFGGLEGANWLSLFTNVPMFRTMRKYSSLLLDLRTRAIATPHLAIVGTQGLPHLSEPNDGVVSVSSQIALARMGVQYREVNLNHFEVLLSPKVATIVSDFIQSVEVL